MYLLDYQFSGGIEPGCFDACDCNDDGILDLSDAINLLGYLFLGQTPPPQPGPTDCGPDPTVDDLECLSDLSSCP